MKRRALISVLLLALFLVGGGGGGPAGAQVVNNHDLAILFRNVVFFTDSGPGWTGKPLFRWSGPIIGHMRGGAEYRAPVIRLFKDFAKLTGLPFRLTDDARRANLQIGRASCRERV